MSIDYEIFEGKSLSSLFKDIYENTQFNRKQLDVLTKELVQFIKDTFLSIRTAHPWSQKPFVRRAVQSTNKSTKCRHF